MSKMSKSDRAERDEAIARLREIDEHCQMGLNSADPKHWEAALQDILRIVREREVQP